MKLAKFLFVLAVVSPAFGQNWTSVTATTVTNPKIVNGTQVLVTGKLCFTATDSSDRQISFQVGGGGQAVTKPACGVITNGALVGTLSIPNPANTAPANIRYRIEVIDNTGVVLRYKNAVVSGDAFDFDLYIPSTTNLVSGQSVDRLTVNHLIVSGDCVGAGCGSGGGTAGVTSFNGSTGVVTYTPSWNSITSKPSTFAPSSHTHVLADLPNCSADGQVWKRVAGVMGCAADATGSGGVSGVSSFNGSTGDISYAPAWTDLTGKPSFFDGAYASLTGKPTLFDGVYSSLTGIPTTFTPAAHNHAESEVTGLVTDLAAKANTASLATVATTGSYNDLISKPTIPAAQVQTDWNAVSGLGVLLNKPTLFDGAYSSLTGKPTLFDGTWTSLTGKPTTFTPSTHATTHASAGSDPITLSESQVTNLTTDLAAKLDSTTAATTYAAKAQPFSISSRYVGMPASSTILFDVLIATYSPAVTVTIPASCSGSIVKSATSTNATGTTTFTLSKNGTTICTFTTAAGSSTTTPSGAGGTLTSTDELKLVYNTADTTFSDPIWVIAGTR